MHVTDGQGQVINQLVLIAEGHRQPLVSLSIGIMKGNPMFHHMTTNNAPVETFDVSGMSPETYAEVLNGIEQAINALEKARIKTDVPHRLHKELGDAILYLIERYEELPSQT